MASTKRLSEDDLRLWAAYGRTLKLLPGKTLVAIQSEPLAAAPPPAEQPRSARLDRAVKTAIGKLDIGHAPPGLDRASWRRFRIGDITPVRSLDLHGLTAARAHRATLAFLQHAQARQQRCVEIITGNGDVLARELPLWLEAPPLRGLILALAYPHAANRGAVRILLRARVTVNG